MPNQKIFNQLLIFMDFYRHAKNEAISSICSAEIVHLKILQSDWLRAFWPIIQEQDLSQILDLCLNPTNNTFHYRTNSVKINDQIFLQIQKTQFLTYLCLISQIFAAKKVFPKNQAVMHNFIGASGTTPKFRGT